MKIERYSCDIESCNNDAVYKQKIMQVIFTTEQTEGRSSPPYLSNVIIDICDVCMSKLLTEKKYIQATGAQGHNQYTL